MPSFSRFMPINRFRFFSLALLLLISLPVGAAVPGKFKQYNMEAGGWFAGFVQHASSGRIYGRTDVGGAYYTDDAGENWNYISGSLPYKGSLYVQALAVEQRDKNTVYQACGVSYFPNDPGRGVWKSTNAGTTWTQLLPNVNFSGNDEVRWGGESLMIHPANEDEVWAGSRANGLWRSLDAGANWTKVNDSVFKDIVFSGIYVHPDFPDQIWVYGEGKKVAEGTPPVEGGAWLSTDHGTTWTKLITAEVVYRMVRKPNGKTFAIGGKHDPSSTTDSHLWVFTATDWASAATYTSTDVWDNYLTAHQAEKGWKPNSNGACLTLLKDGTLITSVLHNYPGKSSDDGATFTILPRTATSDPLPAWAENGATEIAGGFNQLLQDSKDDNRWLFTGGYGPSRSDNAGNTWKHITKGIGQVVSWKVHFHGTDPKKIFLPIADNGVSVITDGGASGDSAGYIAKHFPWPDDNVVFAHNAFGHGSRIIAPGGAAGGADEARIYLSKDDGISWSKMTPNGWPVLSGHPWVDGIVAKDDPDELLLLMGGEAGKGKGGVYRSTDGGVSFTQSTMPTATNGGWFGNEFSFYTRIYRDGGGTERRYLIHRWNKLYRSDDRGVTWSAVSASGLQGPASWYTGILAVDDVTAGKIWLGADSGENTNGEAYGLWKSVNGGDNWTEVGNFVHIDHLAAHDGLVAVWGKKVGDGWHKIYFSDDDGVTWDEVTRPSFQFPEVLGLSIDPYRKGTIWIGQGGRSVASFSPSAYADTDNDGLDDK